MEAMMQELRLFFEQNGHCYVSPKDNKQLFEWIKKIRMSKNELDPSLINTLNSLNFDWRPFGHFDQHWIFMFQKLISYKNIFKHTKVPMRYKEDPRLGVWVSEQRKGKSKLKPWKINFLDRIGFIWNLNKDVEREENWLLMYQRLLSFKELHGHTHVPSTWQEDAKLAKWVIHQRELEKQMSISRKEMLDSINFSWSSKIQEQEEQRWEEKFQQLKAFKEKNGHLNVSTIDPEYHQLSIWIEKQRQKEKEMPSENRDKLNAINFRWKRQIKAEQNNNWNKMYEQLEAFYAKFGHCRVPSHSKEYPQLSIWVQKHRSKWNKLELTKQKKLEKLNFTTSKDIGMEQRQNGF